jgi:LysR family nod box-dependent transcriptional activator
VTAPNFGVVPQLLIGTARVATLQTRLAELLTLTAPLQVLPCPLPMPTLVEVAQWHKYQDRDPALVWFRGLLSRVAQTLDKPPREPKKAVGAR